MATEPRDATRQRYSAELIEHLEHIEEMLGMMRPPPTTPVAPDGGDDDNGDMEHRVTALETRLDTILPTLATKGDIGEVRADIQKGIGETHRWMLGTVIGLFLGFGGLFLAMSNALKPSTTAQPTVIVLPAAQSTASATR